jgi:hypothetical protein
MKTTIEDTYAVWRARLKLQKYTHDVKSPTVTTIQGLKSQSGKGKKRKRNGCENHIPDSPTTFTPAALTDF